jgi:hypothetical protein
MNTESQRAFRVSICGDVTKGCTVAEINWGEQFVASVFENFDGWHIEMYPSGPISLPLDAFLDSVRQTKKKLSCYVNRRGENPPEGLSAAGFSLWLMQKSDGTAMGVKI